MPTPSPEKLSAHQIRALSVEASCDPRSIAKYLAGTDLRPMTRARIERALRAAKLARLVRP